MDTNDPSVPSLPNRLIVIALRAMMAAGLLLILASPFLGIFSLAVEANWGFWNVFSLGMKLVFGGIALSLVHGMLYVSGNSVLDFTRLLRAKSLPKSSQAIIAIFALTSYPAIAAIVNFAISSIMFGAEFLLEFNNFLLEYRGVMSLVVYLVVLYFVYKHIKRWSLEKGELPRPAKIGFATAPILLSVLAMAGGYS